MNIDELTIGEARQIATAFGGQQPQSHPWKIGTAYLIRTVTNYFTGKLVEVHADALVLECAAWIADTGRYADALAKGTFGEVEPIGRVIVGRGAIVDATEWRHDLPLTQK